jgi:uncharacterized cupredoxin-like copper-binding protein
VKTRLRKGLRRVEVRTAACALVLAVAAFAVTGCAGGEPESAEAASSAQAISATLGEFSISLDRSTVATGDVVFEIRNKGAVEHEFVVLKTNLAADKLPASGDEVAEDSIPGAAASKVEVEDIAPGATAKLRARLTPGNYVIICNLPGHYGHGMAAALEVQ